MKGRSCHLTVHHGLEGHDSLPSFIFRTDASERTGREGSRHAVAAGLCLWLTGFCWWHNWQFCWFKRNRNSMKNNSGRNKVWVALNVAFIYMHKMKPCISECLLFRPQSLKEGLTAEQRLHLFDNKDTKDF